MSDRASASYTVKSWDENEVVETDDGGKVTRASVTGEYTGGIEGSATTESVMTYRADGTADFVGMERIVGRVGGRLGSFVLRSVGSYDGRTARSEMEVVEGSGTGELGGLKGAGRFSAEHGPQGTLELDYRFE
jgi:hypothetical protein